MLLDKSDGPSLYQLMILSALQQKPMYMGTVPGPIKARRRAKNRVARQSRRSNRD